MKRSDLVFNLADEMVRHQALAMTSGDYWTYLANLAIKYSEEAGMLPPSIRISTPLGPRIFFDTNEWEEDAKYDEEGFSIK